MKIPSYQKRTWVEVFLDNLRYNYFAIRKSVSNAKICCVIKANAYGHGAEQLALLYQECGADFLAVSNIEEAIQLRNAKIHIPILILGYTDPGCAKILAEKDLLQCVFSKEYGELLSINALKNKVAIKVHIKIDTGMGRIGFNGVKGLFNNDVLKDIESVYKMKGLCPKGIFTHFASADEGDEGKEYTRKQFDCFTSVIDYLQSKKIDVGLRHCANSATIFDYPEMHLDMVRAGIVLYGVHPSNKIKNPCALRPALKLVTIVDFIKEVEKGDCISYGREFIAHKKTKIATLPIGYADGLWRSNFKNGGVVEINGKYAPLVGRICMDQCMVDITEISDVKVGSIATVYGLEGENSINSIAEKNVTINYEILCAIGKRVPRIYIQNDVILHTEDDIVRGNF